MSKYSAGWSINLCKARASMGWRPRWPIGRRSRARWLTWVMGHSEWPIPCSDQHYKPKYICGQNLAKFPSSVSTARAMVARYMLSSYMYVRPCVRLSVTSLSCTNWLNLRSHKQRHMIAQGLWFSDAKNLGDIPTTSPPPSARGGVGPNLRFSTAISL